MTVEFADIEIEGRALRIEHESLGRERTSQPLMVFLHEGLGSSAMWKDFPQRLIDTLGWRGLVYSRPGYGRSTPRAPDEHWSPDFMHRQAQVVLPALLKQLGIVEPIWLFGHSDGASIALLHAAAVPERVSGTIVLAPHIFVEAFGLTSIAKAREAYLSSDLSQRLARYHDDADSAFWGWNDIWLAPAFRSWSIERELASIRCPLLAVQGLEDEYGTLEHIHRIARLVQGAELIELPDCGHSPHRDQPAQVIAAVKSFTHRRQR